MNAQGTYWVKLYYYKMDAEWDLYFSIIEFVLDVFWLLPSGYYMMLENDGISEKFKNIGLQIMIGTAVNLVAITVKSTYGAYNYYFAFGQDLNYNMVSPYKFTFLQDFFDAEGAITDWQAMLVYLEQLLAGKKIKMIADGVLGYALAQHPKTLPFGVFHLIQVPIELIFAYIVFIWWPQYEVPYVPWDKQWAGLPL